MRVCMLVCMLVALVSLTACSKQTSDEGSQETLLKASPMSLLAQRQREAPLFLQAARAAQFSYFAANGVFCGYPRPSKWPFELPPANRSVPWTSNQSVLPRTMPGIISASRLQGTCTFNMKWLRVGQGNQVDYQDRRHQTLVLGASSERFGCLRHTVHCRGDQ